MSDRTIEAEKFLSTWRGIYIISQALEVAIDAIESRPEHSREPSNVSDMRFLRQTLFTFPVTIGTSDGFGCTVMPNGERFGHKALMKGLSDGE